MLEKGIDALPDFSFFEEEEEEIIPHTVTHTVTSPPAA